MTRKIAVLAGDGIGPEIITSTLSVLECLQQEFGFSAELEHAAIGGAGYDQYGQPLPEQTLAICQQADAIHESKHQADKNDGKRDSNAQVVIDPALQFVDDRGRTRQSAIRSRFVQDRIGAFNNRFRFTPVRSIHAQGETVNR